MAFGDNSQQFTTLDDAIARAYEYRKHTKPQFQRLGINGGWFRPGGEIWRGKSYQYNAFTTPGTGVRREILNTAKGQEFPVARDMAYQPLSMVWADLKIFWATAKYNEIDDLKTKADPSLAVAELAEKVVGQIEEDFDTQRDVALFQPGTCEMFTVKQIYNVDGTTFTGAAASDAAYIAIQGGSIAQVQKGDWLCIIDVADHSTINAYIEVNDVIHGKNGPMTSAGTRVSGIGPGIIATPYNSAKVAANWNAVGTPAATDHIARSGEFHNTAASYRNFHGFEDFFNPTVAIFRDESGTAMNRYSAGNQWQVPETFCFDSTGDGTGTAVDFDVDTHFGQVEDVMALRVKTARDQRRSANTNSGSDITLPEVLTLHTTPALVNDVVSQCKDTQRLTSAIAMRPDEATRRRFFGELGGDGFVYHSPTLGYITLNPSAACRPNRMFCVDPQSAFWLRMGNTDGVEWLQQGGSRWMRLEGDTNRTPTFQMQASCWTAMALAWDQVAQNFALKGIKSSRE